MRIHKYSFFSPTSPERRIPIPYGYQGECLTLTPFCLAGSSANRNERWGTRSWAMIGIVFPPSWGCDAKVLGLVSTFHSSWYENHIRHKEMLLCNRTSVWRTRGKNKVPRNPMSLSMGLRKELAGVFCLCLPVNRKPNESTTQPEWNLKDYSGPRCLRRWWD